MKRHEKGPLFSDSRGLLSTPECWVEQSCRDEGACDERKMAAGKWCSCECVRGLIVPVKNAQWVPFCPSWPCLCLQPRGCWATEMSLQISKALPKEKGGCSRNNHRSNYYSVAGSLISTTGYLKGVSSANLRAETYKTEFSRGVKS